MRQRQKTRLEDLLNSLRRVGKRNQPWRRLRLSTSKGSQPSDKDVGSGAAGVDLDDGYRRSSIDIGDGLEVFRSEVVIVGEYYSACNGWRWGKQLEDDWIR